MNAWHLSPRAHISMDPVMSLTLSLSPSLPHSLRSQWRRPQQENRSLHSQFVSCACLTELLCANTSQTFTAGQSRTHTHHNTHITLTGAHIYRSHWQTTHNHHMWNQSTHCSINLNALNNYTERVFVFVILKKNILKKQIGFTFLIASSRIRKVVNKTIT